MRAAGLFGQLVQDRGLRPAVAVDDDDVLEALPRQAREHIRQVGAIGCLADAEPARVGVQAASDAVGHHRRHQRVHARSQRPGDGQRCRRIRAVVDDSVPFHGAGRQQHRPDPGRNQLAEFHPVQVAHLARRGLLGRRPGRQRGCKDGDAQWRLHGAQLSTHRRPATDTGLPAVTDFLPTYSPCGVSRAAARLAPRGRCCAL